LRTFIPPKAIRDYQENSSQCQEAPNQQPLPLAVDQLEKVWKREGRQYPVNAVVKVTIEKRLAYPFSSPLIHDNIEEGAMLSVWLKRYASWNVMTGP
jgi:hypothetical protein